MNKYNFRPLVIDWEITYTCNYKCNFCYLKKKENINANQLLSIAEQLNELHPFEIKLGGGEPLTKPKELFLIAKRLHKDIQLTLVTNGSLVNDLNIKYIKKYFSKVQISLHSLNPEKYASMCNTEKDTLQQVTSNILKLKRNNINTVLNFVLNKQNNEDFKQVYIFAKKHNLKIRILRYRGSKYKLQDDQNFFAKYLEDKSITFDDGFNFNNKGVCGAIKNVLAISPSGTVYPCTWFRDPDMKLGNLLQQNILILLNNKRTQSLRKKLIDCTKKSSEHCPIFILSDSNLN